MPNPDISVLVVDDAKFSNIMIHRLIKGAGYTDIRQASTSKQALDLMEQRPAHILIADWLMPEMDGLSLTQAVRQLDEANNHFTYIMLLTAKEGPEALFNAFEHGVDDFINKSLMSEQLLPRMWAAERNSSMHNRLLRDHQSLIDVNSRLKQLSSVDPLTGLDNRGQAQRFLDESIRYCSSRGGFCCYLLLTLTNMDTLRRTCDSKTMGQLLVSVTRRLRQLVRPLDEVARIAPNQFAVINIQTDPTHCTPEVFRRILEGINVKAYKTAAGFLSAHCAMCMVIYTGSDSAPSAETLMQLAESQIDKAKKEGNISVEYWQAPTG